MDLHVRSGNVFIMQVDDFGNPQSGRIHGGKHRPVFQVIGRIEESVNILPGQSGGELMVDAHAGHPDIIPEDMQDVPVKETMAEL